LLKIERTTPYGLLVCCVNVQTLSSEGRQNKEKFDMSFSSHLFPFFPFSFRSRKVKTNLDTHTMEQQEESEKEDVSTLTDTPALTQRPTDSTKSIEKRSKKGEQRGASTRKSDVRSLCPRSTFTPSQTKAAALIYLSLSPPPPSLPPLPSSPPPSPLSSDLDVPEGYCFEFTIDADRESIPTAPSLSSYSSLSLQFAKAASDRVPALASFDLPSLPVPTVLSVEFEKKLSSCSFPPPPSSPSSRCPSSPSTPSYSPSPSPSSPSPSPSLSTSSPELSLMRDPLDGNQQKRQSLPTLLPLSLPPPMKRGGQPLIPPPRSSSSTNVVTEKLKSTSLPTILSSSALSSDDVISSPLHPASLLQLLLTKMENGPQSSSSSSAAVGTLKSEEDDILFAYNNPYQLTILLSSFCCPSKSFPLVTISLLNLSHKYIRSNAVEETEDEDTVTLPPPDEKGSLKRKASSLLDEKYGDSQRFIRNFFSLECSS
jgi:hypothetical protein